MRRARRAREREPAGRRSSSSSESRRGTLSQVEESLNPAAFRTRTDVEDEKKAEEEEEDDDEGLLEDVDETQPGSRRRRRWSYKTDGSGSGALVHALSVEEAFPTRHGTKYYLKLDQKFGDERLTLSRVGRWFRDVKTLSYAESSKDLDATAADDAVVAVGGASSPGMFRAEYPSEPGVAVSVPAPESTPPPRPSGPTHLSFASECAGRYGTGEELGGPGPRLASRDSALSLPGPRADKRKTTGSRTSRSGPFATS